MPHPFCTSTRIQPPPAGRPPLHRANARCTWALEHPQTASEAFYGKKTARRVHEYPSGLKTSQNAKYGVLFLRPVFSYESEVTERIQNRLALFRRALRLLLVTRPVGLRFQSALGLHLRDVQGADLHAVRCLDVIADVRVRRLLLLLRQPHVLRTDGNRYERLRCRFPR